MVGVGPGGVYPDLILKPRTPDDFLADALSEWATAIFDSPRGSTFLLFTGERVIYPAIGGDDILVGAGRACQWLDEDLPPRDAAGLEDPRDVSAQYTPDGVQVTTAKEVDMHQ